MPPVHQELNPVDPSIDGRQISGNEALADFIASRLNFERLPTERYELQDFKLERMRGLLARLGDPQQHIPCVHIAGTKGKGSTAAMTAAIAQAAGHRVGLFTSPHMEHFSERMVVDGDPPTEVELAALLADLRPVVEAMDATSPDLRATFFEVLTAMAWMHFARRGVELVVLETGLGGRLDATNVCHPIVCVITSISRDHERLLGSTLGAIAGEKAGIIKSAVPVISGVGAEEPRRVIQSAAQTLSAELIELDDQLSWNVSATTDESSLPTPLQGSTIDVLTPWRSHTGLQVPLAGEHQARNLSLAIAAIDAVDSNGLAIPRSAIPLGLRQTHWPLRIEVLNQHPLTIVDAAHNVASIQALVQTLMPVPAARRVLIYATAKDKDGVGMLSELSELFDDIILTRFVNNPRAVSQVQLECFARRILNQPWQWADTPCDALFVAQQIAGKDGLICATGSFFLAAEIRSLVLSQSTQ